MVDTGIALRTGPKIPANVKSYCVSLALIRAPYATGSLMLYGIKKEEYSDSSFAIYIDDVTHPYGIWLDEWEKTGGWKQKQETKDRISEKLTGMKKMKASSTERMIRGRKKYVPGEKVNPHKGWFSERAKDDIIRYLAEYFNGRVMY
jgi:hypothetical protein